MPNSHMILKHLPRPLSALMLTTLVAGGAVGQEVNNTANVYGGVSWFEMDNDRPVDDDLGFYLGGEAPLSERWSGAFEYWESESDFKAVPGDSDNRYIRIGGNYHIDARGPWQPYLAAGIGHMESDLPAPGSAGNTALDLGVGVKRFFSDSNFFLRGDAKVLLGEGGADDFLLGVGIGYAFGPRQERPVTRTTTPPASAPMDSDGDGVPDSRDQCPNTPAGARVNDRGCELDSDADGVVDSRDRCADTDPRHAVDATGCVITEVTEIRQELEVRFETNQAVIRPEFDGIIQEFAEFMDSYGEVNAVIEGHTDSDGAADYNQDLSQRRAQAVVDALVENHGIDRDRLTAIGYGESQPIADNSTAAGKALNRRTVGVVEVEEVRERTR